MSSPSSSTWKAWWERGDWDRLAPAIRTLSMAYARPMCDGCDTADDVVSHVMLRCWRLSYVPDDPCGMVVTMTMNRARDLYKSAYYNTRANVVDAAAAIDPRPSVLDQLIDEEDQRQEEAQIASLLEKLKTLPAIYREVLSLKYLEDLDPDEVNHRLGLDGRSVRMRVTRARRLLRAA